MSGIYIPDVVKELISFYGELLINRSKFPTVKDHLFSLSAKMWEGIQHDVSCVKTEFNNYHPTYLGLDFHSAEWRKLSFDDCLLAIASEYGFNNWDEVEKKGSIAYDNDFQSAIDHLLNGEREALTSILKENPGVIHRSSQYGHRARLIHYCGSNGVELWRQRVPYNLPELVGILRERGADVNATMKVYGGNYDVSSLTTTSAHPKEAGIIELLLDAFKC